ncbi:MAG: hypothetical protein HUN04_06625 [Desulfobacter sp.]|nr:MAG: hypothetical protein HUN04_06625 [Desulfobacter sp.]
MGRNKKNEELYHRKWLILSHCFNMDGRAASQTITDKIPYLMRDGIQPLVISAPTGTKDKAFPHYQVISMAPSGFNFETRKIIEKKYFNSSRARLLKALVTIICLPFLLLEKIFINLDSHWSWFLSASIKGFGLIKRNKPELIYTTAGPSSTHLAGFILNKLFAIPWLAEIHDPLISDHGEKKYQRYAFHKWLEKTVFENACAVFYFTHSACERAEARTGIYGKGHVLRPGASPPSIKKVRYEKRNQIHFGHFGSLAEDRNLYILMAVLGALFDEDPALREKVVLDVYGTALDGISRAAVDRFSLEKVVCEHGRLEFDHFTGKTGRQRVFEKMHLCDVLVLVHGESKIGEEYIPSKLYEYLLVRRPIACIASKRSELASLMCSIDNPVLDSDDFEGIKSGIKMLINAWRKNELNRARPSASLFTVERAVENIIGVVETCLPKPA